MTATQKNRFVPTFEALEAREVASANPVTRPAALLDHAHVRQFQTGPQVMHDAHVPQGQAIAPAAGAPQASYPDPLFNHHRNYVGLKDLKPGDIILNTTEGFVSETIRYFSNASYNHAAIYVGNGEVVEAVGSGVRKIKLTEFLAEGDHIIRSMVLRDANLTGSQREAIADFAKKQVGKPYNIATLPFALGKRKPDNANSFNRDSYYCSQLVAAAYSSAGARLDATLEHSPGELAGMVKSKLTAVGALYDKGYHRSVREGRDCVNLDVTGREQNYVVDLLSTRLNRNGGNYSVRLNRLTVDSTHNVLAHLTVWSAPRLLVQAN
jgi:cell wall-associated NlpC family hydrolase